MPGRGFFRTVLPLAAGAVLLACGPAEAQQPREAQPAGGPAAAQEKVALLDTGAAAPDFRLTDVLGAKFSYGEEGRGRPLILVFFSVFCDPCRAGLAVLKRFQEKYGAGGLEAAAISLDGETLKATVAGSAKQEGYTFRVLLDEADEKQGFRVADSYGVTEIPTLYLVDRRGRIAFAGTGRVAEETLEKAVQAALRK